MTMATLEHLLVTKGHSIRHAMACIDRNLKGIVLVVDDENRLLGTITDGDVRRAILAGLNLDTPVTELLARRGNSPYPKPVTAPVGTEHSVLLGLMQERVVRQIPLLDTEGRVAGLVTLDELMPEEVLPLEAVIMAGGAGNRLRPLTNEIPKPMLRVGDKPILERIIDQLRQAGIRQVNLSTHYKREVIESHFGDGSAFGVDLRYVTEGEPLGTAGALGLMTAPREPLLVINGDILTSLDFRALLAYHREHQADLTVAVRQYDLNVPYGVVEAEGVFIRKIVEKPLLNFFVNAGIYLLEPSVHQSIPNGQRLDMTELIQLLIERGRRVVSFPVVEYWLDVGQPVDFERAGQDVVNGRLRP